MEIIMSRDKRDYYEDYYEDQFAKSGFFPCDIPAGFPPSGICYTLSSEYGGGYYWYYEIPDQYNIKIHDFWFREDTVLNMMLPECLSVTWYDSISGEELKPYRKLNCQVVKSFLGGYEPFHALIHRNVPIRSIGIEYRPEYYNRVLKELFGELYQNPIEAFQSLDETADFPEMKKLLKEVWNYKGDSLSTALYYNAKANEALALIFERHRRLNQQRKTTLPQEDKEMLDSLARYIGDHFADELSIETLAKIGCMGTTKLKKAFKLYFGCTVAEYIQRVRIDHAEHLLAYTELPVGEVAKAVGYSAAGHFAKLFADSKGILPMEYRRAMLERENN